MVTHSFKLVACLQAAVVLGHSPFLLWCLKKFCTVLKYLHVFFKCELIHAAALASFEDQILDPSGTNQVK